MKRKTFSEVPEAEQNRSDGRCQAHNCNLPGTISHSTTGPHAWVCWAHDRCKEPGKWPYLTNGIAENQWLFSLAARVVNMTAYEMEHKRDEMVSYLKGRAREDLLQGEKENSIAWARRLRDVAYRAAMDHASANYSRAA